MTRWRTSCARCSEQVPLSGDDRLLAVTTIGFDIAALELYLPLLSGACVTVVPGETVKDVPALLRAIGASGATVMQATPTLWQALLEPCWRSRADGSALAGLRMLVGGEALSAPLARAMRGLAPLGEQSVRPDRDHDLVGDDDAGCG